MKETPSVRAEDEAERRVGEQKRRVNGGDENEREMVWSLRLKALV